MRRWRGLRCRSLAALQSGRMTWQRWRGRFNVHQARRKTCPVACVSHLEVLIKLEDYSEHDFSFSCSSTLTTCSWLFTTSLSYFCQQSWWLRLLTLVMVKCFPDRNGSQGTVRSQCVSSCLHTYLCSLWRSTIRL